jgi:hypothetical protein
VWLKGFRGVPVVFFEDGTRIAGATVAPEIEKRLAVASPAKLAAAK